MSVHVERERPKLAFVGPMPVSAHVDGKGPHLTPVAATLVSVNGVDPELSLVSLSVHGVVP